MPEFAVDLATGCDDLAVRLACDVVYLDIPGQACRHRSVESTVPSAARQLAKFDASTSTS